MIQLSDINCFDNYSIRHSLSGWKTTAVVLDEPHHVIRFVLLIDFMAKRNYDGMVDIRKVLRVESPDELFQFLLLNFLGHFLQDQRSFSQHGDGPERMGELGLVFDWLNQTLSHRYLTS